MFVFQKIWRALFLLKYPFQDSPFYLFSDNSVLENVFAYIFFFTLNCKKDLASQ